MELKEIIALITAAVFAWGLSRIKGLLKKKARKTASANAQV